MVGLRLQALVRLLVLLPAYVISLFLSPLLLLGLAVVFIVDIVLQGVFGVSGVGMGNPVQRLWDWYRKWTLWVVYG